MSKGIAVIQSRFSHNEPWGVEKIYNRFIDLAVVEHDIGRLCGAMQDRLNASNAAGCYSVRLVLKNGGTERVILQCTNEIFLSVSRIKEVAKELNFI